MKIMVSTWGNSLAVRIPKGYAEDIGLHNGSEVSINLKGKSLVIKPNKIDKPEGKRKRKYKLEDLARKMTRKNTHDIIEWGEPVGKETW